MPKSRLCLRDKSSILVENSIDDIYVQINKNEFIRVTNSASGRDELHSRKDIWCVRQHREEVK